MRRSRSLAPKRPERRDPHRTPAPGHPRRRRADGGASARLTRLLFIAAAAASVIFGVLSLGPFLAQMHHPVGGISVTAWLLAFGLPVALGALAHHVPLRILRAIAVAEGAVFVTILLTWLVLWAEPLHLTGIPWVITFAGVPSVVVAIVAPPRLAWAYTVLVCTVSGLLRAASSTDPQRALIGLEDGLYTFLLVSVFVGLTLAMRSSAARVDEAARVSGRIEAGRAGRLSRKHERLTIDALVHDSVISTLLMAGLGRARPGVIAREAGRTLGQLDHLRMPGPQTVLLNSEAMRRLERLTKTLAPDAAFRIEPGVERTVPTAAVAAVLGAVGEAVRNSVAAAGVGRSEAVFRAVTVRCVGGGIQVVVQDDGVGFDPAAVSAERLGISQSILGRMDRVPGGSAIVRSAPGAGTEVHVSWAPEPPPPEPAPIPAALTAALARRAALAARASRPAASATPSLSEIVGLSPGKVRAILVLFIGVHGLLAVANARPMSGVGIDLIAFFAVSAAAVWLTRSPADVLPRWPAVGVLALCSVTVLVMFRQIPAEGAPPFAHWHLGAVTFVLLVLVGRSRTRWAWAGYLGMTAVTVAWALTSGLTAADGVELAIRHAGTLLAGTLFVLGLRRSAHTLRVMSREASLAEAAESVLEAAVAEREAQLDRINALARPALERLARSHWEDLDASERAECLLVEASLRDAIRGRSLFLEPAISAARAARSRGVEVTLLDDSGDHPPQPAALSALVGAVAAELAAIGSGRLTARVLPAGRSELATIVVESAEQRMLLLTPDGAVREA